MKELDDDECFLVHYFSRPFHFLMKKRRFPASWFVWNDLLRASIEGALQISWKLDWCPDLLEVIETPGHLLISLLSFLGRGRTRRPFHRWLLLSSRCRPWWYRSLPSAPRGPCRWEIPTSSERDPSDFLGFCKTQSLRALSYHCEALYSMALGLDAWCCLPLRA